MSVVKDFFKLRKYNIHEVNEQIHKSQKNSKIEDGKVNNEATEPEDRTASKDDTHSTTVDNPACTRDNTESQENSGELLNQNSSHVSSVTKEPKDEGESRNCQDNNLVKWNLAHTGICCYMDIITHRGVLNEVFGERPQVSLRIPHVPKTWKCWSVFLFLWIYMYVTEFFCQMF